MLTIGISKAGKSIEQYIHIFTFLTKKPKLTLYFDPQDPLMDINTFKVSSTEESREQYRDAREQILLETPKPHGRPDSTTANHVQNKKTIRSNTIVFLWFEL